VNFWGVNDATCTKGISVCDSIDPQTISDLYWCNFCITQNNNGDGENFLFSFHSDDDNE
jgi:hypothetical protein